jgi:hypothetical protein
LDGGFMVFGLRRGCSEAGGLTVVVIVIAAKDGASGAPPTR